VTPRDINLVGIIGFPSPFPVAPIQLKRNFQDSNSFRLGGELSLPGLFDNSKFTLRAGVAYEDSAVPVDYVSPISVDTTKITTTAGFGLGVGANWRFDAMFAQIFASRVDVDPATAKLAPVNPVKGNPAPTTAINGGSYEPRAFVVGIGLNYEFGKGAKKEATAAEAHDKPVGDSDPKAATPSSGSATGKPGEWNPNATEPAPPAAAPPAKEDPPPAAPPVKPTKPAKPAKK
jgi:hypothetical protein